MWEHNDSRALCRLRLSAQLEDVYNLLLSDAECVEVFGVLRWPDGSSVPRVAIEVRGAKPHQRLEFRLRMKRANPSGEFRTIGMADACE